MQVNIKVLAFYDVKVVFSENKIRCAKRLRNAFVTLHRQNKGSMVERFKTALC